MLKDWAKILGGMNFDVVEEGERSSRYFSFRERTRLKIMKQKELFKLLDENSRAKGGPNFKKT